MNKKYTTNTSKKDKSGQSNRTAIISVIIVLVLVTAAIAFALCSCDAARHEDDLDIGTVGIIYDDAAVSGGWESLSQEEIESKLNNQLEEGMINISMNTSPYFENGSAEGNLMIVNETINRYPQKVEIVRNDTQELIYTSGAIPVGSKIEADALDVGLSEGIYECTAYFHNLDPNTGNIIGSAGAIINITINN